jgi:hypothetical protein
MDRLTAFVAIAQLRLRLDIVQRHPQLLEKNMATPFLQGLTKEMDMLEHDLEEDAKGLVNKIRDVRQRGKAAIGKGHARIDGVASRVAEVDKFVTTIEGSNGGGPLQGSSDASAQSEPAASWQGDQGQG